MNTVESQLPPPKKNSHLGTFGEAGLSGFIFGLGFFVANLLGSEEFRSGWWLLFGPVMVGGLTALVALPNWIILKVVRAINQNPGSNALIRRVLYFVNGSAGLIFGWFQNS